MNEGIIKKPLGRKVVIVTNIPTPYRIPLFNKVKDIFEKNMLKLKVIFCTRGYRRRKWNFDHEKFHFEYSILRDPKIVIGEKMINLSGSLFFELIKERPDVIISVGFSVPTLIVWLYCKIFNARFILWSGETPELSIKRKDFIGFRHYFRKKLIKDTKSCIAYGRRAAAYLESLGKPRNKVFIAINTVDTTYYSHEVDKLRLKKEEIKTNMCLPQKNILFVGYLSKRKGVEFVLRAFDLLETQDVGLHIIGDGQYRDTLKNLARRLDLKNVYFWGYKQKNELPLFYAIADVFIFSSLKELWGLTIIEAMTCGLPMLCSNMAGATPDLIHDGLTGFVVNPTEVKEMARILSYLFDKPHIREEVGMRARKFIEENITLDHSAKGFLEAVNSTI